MIAIIDYGMGNIHSVKKALESVGASGIFVTNKADAISRADKLVFPGVGAFGDAVLELKNRDLVSAMAEHIKNKKTFLGICLGMHILFEASEESPGVRGLGILKGIAKKFKDAGKMKVPHMGWNQLRTGLSTKEKGLRICPLLKGVPDNSYVYFCHSYYPDPVDKAVIAATTDYAGDFASIVWQDNVYGVQFHPEKSQETGLAMLKNFVELC